MANTITLSGLTEILFKSRDIVARELTGCISAVMLNAGSAGVSLGGTVVSMKTAQPTLNTTFTPAMVIPSGDDQTISSNSVAIGQVANVKIPLTGETTLQLINTVGFEAAMTQLFTQAMRTIANAVESHTCTVAYKGASRAFGTAGTTPFASTLSGIPQVRQILVDNGMTEPEKDRMCSLIINTSAGTNLRLVPNLLKVNESGSTDLLRQGVLGNVSGLNIAESAGIVTTTAGTMASATSTAAAFTVGQTVIPLALAGTGVVAAGDSVTFANDANVYVVASVSFAGANPASGDSITLNAPGLRKAQGAATRAITVTAAAAQNFALHRQAVELIMRPPAMPPNLSGGMGDAAAARITLFDQKTGLVFEAAVYLGYGMNMVDITTFYQAKVWKPEFIAVLLG